MRFPAPPSATWPQSPYLCSTLLCYMHGYQSGAGIPLNGHLQPLHAGSWNSCQFTWDPLQELGGDAQEGARCPLPQCPLPGEVEGRDCVHVEPQIPSYPPIHSCTALPGWGTWGLAWLLLQDTGRKWSPCNATKNAQVTEFPPHGDHARLGSLRPMVARGPTAWQTWPGPGCAASPYKHTRVSMEKGLE